MKYLLIALVTLSLAGGSLAAHHGDKGQHGDMGYMQKMTKKLELSEEQSEAVKKLHEQYHAEKRALREQHREAMSEVLDEEQMKKYLKMKAKRHHKGDKKAKNQ